MLGNTAVAVLVAATIVLEASVTRTSLMTFVVLIGPVWSVFVMPLHCCQCFENFANTASACAAVITATSTPAEIVDGSRRKMKPASPQTTAPRGSGCDRSHTHRLPVM